MAWPELAEQIAPTTDEDLLLQAEQMVRDYCGWHIAPARTETLTLDGSGGRAMVLPTLNLTAVASITEDDVALDLTTIEWSSAGILRRCHCYHACGCRWTRRFRGVVASITHGYDSAPADVSGVVQALAGRAKGNTAGLQSKTIGPFSETYSTDLLSTEMTVLARYRLPSRP